jgi:tRNA (guanine-N7-)-methyltransferase
MESTFKYNFYGRRKGRGKKSIHDDLFHSALDALSIDRWKDRWPDPLWMEIGFGFGDHLNSWLTQNLKSAILGVEVFETGIVHCMESLKNCADRCALFPHPVANLLPLLPDGMLEGIFILFPDPWPKKRHHKRRLVQTSFLEECYRLLKPKGVIRFASDHPDLVEFTLTQVNLHGKFQWVQGARTAYPAEWPTWPDEWSTSRYHQKAMAQNKPCAAIVWQKP